MAAPKSTTKVEVNGTTIVATEVNGAWEFTIEPAELSRLVGVDVEREIARFPEGLRALLKRPFSPEHATLIAAQSVKPFSAAMLAHAMVFNAFMSAAQAVVKPEVPPALSDADERERKRILTELRKHNWHRGETAKALGMPSRTFYQRLKEYGLKDSIPRDTDGRFRRAG